MLADDRRKIEQAEDADRIAVSVSPPKPSTVVTKMRAQSAYCAHEEALVVGTLYHERVD